MNKKPLRIAIYARYSDVLQNPSSVDDQVALCRKLIAKEFGGAVTAIFSDAAQTGATMAREGLTGLLLGVQQGRFDIVVAEGLDRISRSLADIATIYRTLQAHEVRLWTAHEREVSELHVGFKGTMDALYLTDMKQKVRRGHHAVIADGRSAASIPYGYRAVRGVTDERGRYINGLREIDEEKAAIVRRIYEEVASGIKPSQVVRSLNEDGIPAPNGGTWKLHSVTGERTRGRGILSNEMYRGWLIYGKTRRLTDPVTGRQRMVPRPEEEHIRQPAPELRIVSDEVWDKVQSRLRPRNTSARLNELPTAEKPPETLGDGRSKPLTGLVKCGWCGGQKSMAHETRYVCNTFKFYEQRCKNGRGTKEEVVAEATFLLLREAVETEPDWQARLLPYLGAEHEAREKLNEEAARLKHRLERLLDAIERGISPETTVARIKEVEHRLAEIRALPKLPEIETHDGIRHRLLLALDRMQAEFTNRKYARPIGAALALVVDSIILTPTDEWKGEHIDIRLKPGSWPEFYVQVHSQWPRVGKG